LKNESDFSGLPSFSNPFIKIFRMHDPEKKMPKADIDWFLACQVGDLAANGGVCIKRGEQQIALFYFARRHQCYASQNECPHKQQMALSRGLTGSQGDEPKIACPFHKRTFSLVDGHCLNDDACEAIKTYPVKVENEQVFVGFKIMENLTE
jgi:nitrite reductase (NADH) small subunit